MFDPERGWSISYVGSGFLGVYYIGVSHCLMERAPHILRDARMIFGASGGALHCVFSLSGVPLEQKLQILMDLVRWVRSHKISIFHPSINVMAYMQHCLRQHLPADIHRRISGKACLSLTRVEDYKNVLVSEFHSKEEVIDALMCTCFIPFYSGFIPPSFRGVRYIDGGLTNNAPCIDSKTTIFVSPFYGESDICPRGTSTNFQIIEFISLHLRVCSENIYLTTRSLVPPSTKVCMEICVRGYLDTVRFLEENGICDRPQRSLSAPSEEPQVHERPRECGELASQGVLAAPEVKLEDDLLDHLRLSISQWEERFLQILSPKLILALRETVKDPDGYLSKVCGLLPVKVLSYALLPCTLPVETALHAVRRLMLWVPSISEDLPWLWGTASRLCAQQLTHLLPAARSQAPESSAEPPPHDREDSGPLRPPGSPADADACPEGRPVAARATSPRPPSSNLA